MERYTRTYPVNDEFCGNFKIIDDQKLLLWKNELQQTISGTVSVFNSEDSTEDVQVIINTHNDIYDESNKDTDQDNKEISFQVKPGNTISRTISELKSIYISNSNKCVLSGKYCLKIHYCIACEQEEE